MNYQEYIVSPEWRAKAKARMRLDNFTCQRCEAKRELTVHHKTYERLGHELMEDLETLCVRCHNDIYYFNKRELAPEAMVLCCTPVIEDEFIAHKQREAYERIYGDEFMVIQEG